MENRFVPFIIPETAAGKSDFAKALAEYRRLFSKEPPGEGITFDRYLAIVKAIEADDSLYCRHSMLPKSMHVHG